MIRSSSKLFRLLSTLSEEECARFGEFLHSPFHQKSQKILDLWKVLHPWLPVEGEPSEQMTEALDKNRVFTLLFPGKPYKDSNLSNLMTTMGNLLDEFWAHQQLTTFPQLRQRLLLQVYREREALSADFERLWKSIERQRTESGKLDPENLFLLLSIREVYLSFQSEHQPRNASLALQESLEVLDELTIFLHLKYYLAALNRQRLVGEGPDLLLQETIWSFLNAHPEKAEQSPVRTYVWTIRGLLLPEDSAVISQARSFFQEDAGLLADHEAKTLAYTLLNAVNLQLKSEGAQVLPELLDMYRTCYDLGFLFTGEYLDKHVYLNILNVATGVVKQSEGEKKEALEEWRANFAKENYLRLHPDHREETYLYATAYLAYQSKNFPEAYQLLNQYKPKDMLTDLSRRSLMIRVYYDAWDSDLLDSQVKSSLMYISRASAVSDQKRGAYNRFVKITRKLSGLRGKQLSDTEINKIQEDINAPGPLECRQWLTEKVEDLRQRMKH